MQGIRKVFSNKRSRIILISIAAVCAAVIAVGGVMAKYIASNYQRAEMESAHFHISSDYLDDTVDAPEYKLVDLKDGFDIHLYNYELDNIELLSAMDISYKIQAENAVVESVKTSNGSKVAANENVYTLSNSAEKTHHVIHIKPKDDLAKDDKITVTLTSTSPYKKILKAIFMAKYNNVPEYNIKDNVDGTVLITVLANEYSGNITVNWDKDKYSPDNTNKLMSGWTDAVSSGNFAAEENHEYELLFFKKTGDNYSESIGTGATINLN